MAADKSISPNFHKNFIVARAAVDWEYLNGKKIIIRISAPAKIEIAAGYSLYFLNNENMLEQYDLVAALGKLELGDAICKRICDKLGAKQEKVNLFWVRRNDIKITVPWGFVVEKDEARIGVNGQFTFTIPENGLDAFLKNNYFAWDSEVSGGIRYDYLSEYFIDSEKRQNGISIELRDELLLPLKDVLSKYEISPENSVALQQKIREEIASNEQISAIMKKSGLAFDMADDNKSQSIDVNFYFENKSQD